MQYVAVVKKEGNRRLVEFPDCPGCQTFAEAGEDPREVGRDALEGWLEAHLVRGCARSPFVWSRSRSPAATSTMATRARTSRAAGPRRAAIRTRGGAWNACPISRMTARPGCAAGSRGTPATRAARRA